MIGLVDLIYPPRCPLCDSFVDRPDVPCGRCAHLLHSLDGDASVGHVLHSWIDGCASCFAYDGVLKDALHGFKYLGRLDQVRFFGDALVRRSAALWAFDVIVPVPMYPRKLKKRGFNQAALLARYLGKACGKPVWLDALVRLRDDEAQVELKRNERIGNVRNAFGIGKGFGPRIGGKAFLIVDDVMTTGATANECARALKKGHASKAYVLTVARTLGG